MTMTSNDWKYGIDQRNIDAIEDRLVDGESVLAVSQIAKGIYWQAISVAILTFILAISVAVELAYVLGATTILMALYALWREKVFIFVLTDKRIFVRSGLIQMEMVDIRFDKIESMETEQMITGYAMGYAKLVVMGTGNRYISMPYVANAKIIRKKFNEIVLKD